METGPLSFSFQFLRSTSKFNLDQCSQEFLIALPNELQKTTGTPVCDFCEYDRHRNSHHISFENTTEPNGFGLDEQIEPDAHWQFALKPKSPWRIHGFFIDCTFYIVWLDEHHRLDPAYQRG